MIKNAFIQFNSFLLHSFVFRTKYNITMKTIKSIFIILLAILASGNQYSINHLTIISS